MKYPARIRERSYPSLFAWWEEVRSGTRSRMTFDPLLQAACAEALAMELASVAPEVAASYRRDARRIIEAAVGQ